MLRPGLVGALCALALLLSPAADAGAAAGVEQPRAILAFLPEDKEDPNAPSVLDRLDRREELALGVMGATQGRYSPEQTLLDITQGVRISAGGYSTERAPELSFARIGPAGAFFFEWDDAVERAEDAPARIIPGLLAETVPGGVGYAGVSGRAQLEAVVAADEDGRIAADDLSIGPARTVARRALALLADHRLVVAGLPTGKRGARALDELLAGRRTGTLLIVVETPPDVRSPQLLPIGITGLGGAGGLTSSTTRQDGIVAAIDLMPTILHRLRVPIPSAVKGQRIRVDGRRDAERLDRLTSRLRVVLARRVPALEALVVAMAILMLFLGVVRDRAGVLRGGRISALALLWVPVVLLGVGELQPSRDAEMAYTVLACLGLGALTDWLVPWPRGPGVPAALAIVAYTVDLAQGSDLIIRSLLGPNPRFGSRFYGIGNELEIILSVLLLVAVAAALHGRGRSRGAAAAFGVAGLAFGAVLGSGRLGADVGGVITLGAGVAAACVLMLPRVTARAVAVAVLVPGLALLALALLDLATGGDGHFTRTVLRAESGEDLADVVVRRYELAWNALTRGGMPFLTALALLAVAYALRHRRRVYAAIETSASWRAALGGGLAAALAGALFNDSGPVLLVFGVFVLGFLTLYLRGDPARERALRSG